MSPEPDKRPSRRWSLLKKLALLLTSLVVALGLAEIGLRIFVTVTDAEIAAVETAFVESSEKLHAFDPEIGWVLKPNYDRDDIVMNSLGFRMSTEPAPASGRRKRNVVLLGLVHVRRHARRVHPGSRDALLSPRLPLEPLRASVHGRHDQADHPRGA